MDTLGTWRALGCERGSGWMQSSIENAGWCFQQPPILGTEHIGKAKKTSKAAKNLADAYLYQKHTLLGKDHHLRGLFPYGKALNQRRKEGKPVGPQVQLVVQSMRKWLTLSCESRAAKVGSL